MINPILERRRAGVLLHITSLPGEGETGDLGENARYFIHFLADCDQTVWQMLPIGPVEPFGSPYQSYSAFAGNLYLTDAVWLAEKGLLSPERARKLRLTAKGRLEALQEAYRAFLAGQGLLTRVALDDFCRRHSDWLEDFALFVALKRRFDHKPWWEWPPSYRDRDAKILSEVKRELHAEIGEVKFSQFVFFEQWRALKNYANDRGVKLFGDMPIFIAADSADVWANRKYFLLDEKGLPTVVAGVPPDAFSPTGQRWGNPIYNWKALEHDDFKWWIRRVSHARELFDWIRIDHFRGFEAYWEIPASSPTAEKGRWVKAPGEKLFKALFDHFGDLPLVAEDLGTITPEVVRLRRRFQIPGMVVLQFAFDGLPDNLYLPHNHEKESIVYTGTHDNDTTLVWFEGLDESQKRYLYDYLFWSQEPMPRLLMRTALMSNAQVAILPMQDILELGKGHRMNTPATIEGNWRWRFEWSWLKAEHCERLRGWTRLYGRV